MRTTMQYKYLLAITCAFMLVGCQQSGKSDKVQGNAPVQAGDKTVNKVRKHVNFSGTFYQITNLGTPDIIYTQGPYNFEVEGAEDLVDELALSIDYNVMTVSLKDEEKIDMNRFNSNKGKLTLYISCPTLKAIATCGTGGIHIKGKLEGDEFQVGCLGTGSIEIDTLNMTNMRYDSMGDGNLSFHFIESESANFILSGKGKLEGSIAASGPVILDSNSASHVSLRGKAGRLSLIISGNTECDLNMDADTLDVTAQSGVINITGKFKTKRIDKGLKANVALL